MKTHLTLAAALVLVVIPAGASALVVEEQVTPAFIKENPDKFSVKATKQDDGRIEFTITRKLNRPVYFVASFQVRTGGKLVAECRHPSFGLEDSETYYLTVSPDQVAESVFELSENSFASGGGVKTPLPGGIDYVIRLKDFPPQANEQAAPKSR